MRKLNPKKNYARGRRAEYKVIEKLRAEGYTTIRSAGSKGLWDIVAYKWASMRWVVIQVKRNKKPSLKETKALKKEKVPFAAKELWLLQDGQKEIGVIPIE